jgi:hypothetical protein
VLVVQGKTQYLSYELPESATSSGMTTPVSSDNEDAKEVDELEDATPPVISGLPDHSSNSIKPRNGVLRIGEWDTVEDEEIKGIEGA